MAEADRVVREKVRSLVLAKDQAGFEAFLAEMLGRVGAGLLLPEAASKIINDLNVILTEEVLAAPHDVHTWWMGECNCDGHLN